MKRYLKMGKMMIHLILWCPMFSELHVGVGLPCPRSWWNRRTWSWEWQWHHPVMAMIQVSCAGGNDLCQIQSGWWFGTVSPFFPNSWDDLIWRTHIFQRGGWRKTTSDPIVSRLWGDGHQSINWGCIPTKRIVIMGLWDDHSHYRFCLGPWHI